MWANTITKQYTRDHFIEELKVKDPWVMAKGLLSIAINKTYKGIQENTNPTEEYKTVGFETCKELVALAAYRLADMLNKYL